MSSSVDTTHPPLFDFSLASSCTVHNPRTPSRPHASRASRYHSSPVTPRSGLRRTSRLGVTAAPRTCSRYLPWGGESFAHPHQRASVPSLSLPPLSVAHACTHTQNTHSPSFFCASEWMIRPSSASSSPLCARFSSRTLLFSPGTVRQRRSDAPVSLRSLYLLSLSRSAVTECSLLQPVSSRSQPEDLTSLTVFHPCSTFTKLLSLVLSLSLHSYDYSSRILASSTPTL